MTYVVRPFTKYVAYYISGGGSPAIGRPYEAEIDCFNETDERVGMIAFFPDDASLPAPEETVNGIYLYYKMSRFNDVMTMLRFEKPLELWLEPDVGVGYIATASEPVGEQEGVGFRILPL